MYFSVLSTCYGNLNFEKNLLQRKLVSVARGKVFDVEVEIRPDSPTFGQLEAILLCETNNTQL